jgi:hypothetical protein
MATTIDNPNNPFTNYDAWYAHDHKYGHNTGELVAYFNEASSAMDDDMYEYETNLAINRLLEFNPTGLYMKLYEKDADKYIAIANKVFKEYYKTID